MQKILNQFYTFCQDPNITSGKARSYAYAITYLCEYLEISSINGDSISKMKSIENYIYDKNSSVYKELLSFLEGRGQKSYLTKGWIRAALKHFYSFVEQQSYN